MNRQKYEKKLTPAQKFRAGVYCVIAAIRMSNLEEQWRDAKMIGDELRQTRKRQKKQNNGQTVKEV